MYNSVLPVTGAGIIASGATGVWWALAAFALIAAGTAIARIVPTRS